VGSRAGLDNVKKRIKLLLPGTEPRPSSRLTGWFLSLFFNHEDGGSMFLLNVNQILPDCTASYPRRLYSS
jgi:hypothetical protein